MSLASLAAYVSSDNEADVSDEASNDPVVPVPAADSSSGVCSGTTRLKPGSHDPAHVQQQSILSECLFEADDVVDDVPLASAMPNQIKSRSGPKKIILPSLCEIEDDDHPRPKKLKSSSMKSGLFSLLPQPKTCSNVSSFVPSSVSHSSKKSSAATKVKSYLSPSTVPVSASADSDDEDQHSGVGVNFFSLSDECASGSGGGQHSYTESETTTLGPRSPASNTHFSSSVDYPTVSNLPEQVPAPYEAVSVYGEALDRLCGRRRRADECESIIIEVKQDDILPDKQQLETQLLANTAVKRRPQKSSDDPTAQQRRKHQITYLAHQAKDREVELQLEWSQNRATKQAYKNKYGF